MSEGQCRIMSNNPEGKRKTTTSTAVKQRYNKKTYRRFEVSIRRDDPLIGHIDAYTADRPGGLSDLVKRLLGSYFRSADTAAAARQCRQDDAMAEMTVQPCDRID